MTKRVFIILGVTSAIALTLVFPKSASIPSTSPSSSKNETTLDSVAAVSPEWTKPKTSSSKNPERSFATSGNQGDHNPTEPTGSAPLPTAIPAAQIAAASPALPERGVQPGEIFPNAQAIQSSEPIQTGNQFFGGGGSGFSSASSSASPSSLTQSNGVVAVTNEVVAVTNQPTEVTEKLPASFFNRKATFAGRRVQGDASFQPAGLTAAQDALKASGRSVVESDIWKISGNRLFYFNQYRGLQVIDISNPDTASLIGALSMPAAGEQMYLLDATHVALITRGSYGTDGYESKILVVNVASATPVIEATVPVSGYVLESRLVGSALYLATQTYQTKGEEFGEWGTLVSSFDLSKIKAPVNGDSLWLPGYGAVITATDQFLFVTVQDAVTAESDVHCIDISEVHGRMELASTIHIAGQVADKFKINLADDVLAVVFEQTDWNSSSVQTLLETYSLADPQAPEKLGALALAEGERLHATRFDSNRVYIVTFEQTDPLWIVDLSEPKDPKIQGQVEVPGWSSYIQPLGNRLVTIGQSAVGDWSAAVSLFDVSDPTNPLLLNQLPLGDNYSWSEAGYDEKALAVLPDAGLILVPYQGDFDENGYASRVQLIELGDNALKLRGVIDHKIQPRRATVDHDRILSISGSEFLSVSAEDLDHPQVRRSLTLAWPVDRVFMHGDFLLELGGVNLENQNPAIRVASVNAPDHLLSQWSLTNLFLLGATVRGDFLYVLQGEAASYFPIYRIQTEGGEKTTPAKNPNGLLSVIDLSRLPEVEIAGQTETELDSVSYNSNFKPLWPKDGVLVWANINGNNRFPGWYSRISGPIETTESLVESKVNDSQEQLIAEARPIRWPQFWNQGVAQLITFDVRDGNSPWTLSTISLTNAQYDSEGVFATNGLVYVSHKTVTADDETAENETAVGDNGEISIDVDGDQKPVLPEDGGIAQDAVVYKNLRSDWIERSYLDIIDFANPATPQVRDAVEISGPIAGLSHQGSVIYTIGQNTGEDGSLLNDQVDALAYDGTNIFYIDSLPFSGSWLHPVLTDGHNLFLSDVKNENAGGLVESWTLQDSGNFRRIGHVSLSAPVEALSFFDDVLAVKSGVELQLFESTKAGSLKSIGSGSAPGDIWFDFNFADGARDRGVRIPLGVYGVWSLNISR